MKIAIISDSHDHIEPLDKVLGYLKKNKIKILIHCGDVSSIETLNYILQHFCGTVYLSRGNADNFYAKQNDKNFYFFENVGRIVIDGKKISFVHKITDIKHVEIKNSDIVFYGHDHKPWMKIADKTIIANPVNCAGIGYMSTFAVYDTTNNKIKLEIIDKLVK